VYLKGAIYRNFLAPFDAFGKRISVHLKYVEVPDCIALSKVKSPVIGASTIIGYNLPDKVNTSHQFTGATKGTLSQAAVEAITSDKTNLDLLLAVFLKEELNQDPCKRKELLAREITTVYRRAVTILLNFCLGAAYGKKFEAGSQVADDIPIYEFQEELEGHTRVREDFGSDAGSITTLHSTMEDSWRLVCGFHLLEQELDMFNHDLRKANRAKDTICSLSDFFDELTSHVHNRAIAPNPSRSFFELLENRRAVGRRIALRKTTEYFLYEDLPANHLKNHY